MLRHRVQFLRFRDHSKDKSQMIFSPPLCYDSPRSSGYRVYVPLSCVLRTGPWTPVAGKQTVASEHFCQHCSEEGLRQTVKRSGSKYKQEAASKTSLTFQLAVRQSQRPHAAARRRDALRRLLVLAYPPPAPAAEETAGEQVTRKQV